MNERTRTAKKNKGKEAVESHDRPCLERTWHIKRERRHNSRHFGLISKFF